MQQRLPPGRIWLLSAAAHAALLAVLFPLVGGGGKAPGPRRVETGFEVPVAMEDPLPVLPETAPPEVRVDPAQPLLDESIPEATDPRLDRDSDALGPAAAGPADSATVIGLGGGGRRFRAARGPTAAAAPAPEVPPPAEEPAPEAPPAPAVPDVRARPHPGACPGPAYPARERRLGVEGLVEVQVEVGEEGEVRSAGVLRSSGSEGLDDAALAAVQGWRFDPATEKGVPVPDQVVIPVRFRIDAARSMGQQRR